MLTNGNRSNCGFEDVMVSYIYDEIATAERRKFESHLVDCSVCTDEFAAISNARLSVFEWQKEEFAHLSTPEIVVPDRGGKKVVENDSPVGFLEGIRGLFSGFGVPAAAAVGLVICLGAGFIAMTFIGQTDEQMAANIKVAQPDTAREVGSIPELNETPNITSSNDRAPTFDEPKPVKTAEIRRPRGDKQTAFRQTAVGAKAQPTRQAVKAPVLSNFDDNDDRSLRLADLFSDEIGGGR